jgi:hypothetical protein
MTKKNEMVKKGEGNLPAEMNDLFNQDANKGFENTTQEDFALPLLYLLQPLSPQVQDEDAPMRAGDFFHNVANLALPGKAGFRVIPTAYRKSYVEWVPRDAGGGFVAQYDTRDEADASCDVGNEIKETVNLFLLVEMEADGAWVEVVMPCTSTKLKKTRHLMTLMSMKKIPGTSNTAPMFGQIFRLYSTQEKNDKGTFYNIAFDFDSFVGDVDLYTQARGFHTVAQTFSGIAPSEAKAAPAAEASDEPEDVF